VIGYCVPSLPQLASFRLRVDIPRKHLGMKSQIGIGDATFFFKNGNPLLARGLPNVVYDVVNPHFDNPDYRAMCEVASVITCSSEAMRPIIKSATGRDAVVIDDPYENGERLAEVFGERVLWFGHQANIESLRPYRDLNVDICSHGVWSLENEALALESAAVVLLTGTNPGASPNRPVKAIRAGRFVVAPEDCPSSWRELSEYIWIGDVRKGIRWALANREEACLKVSAGQEYVRNRFSPQSIGSQWADLFGSILGADTSKRKVGSALTSP
jgi:hypothetical protein